MAEILLSALLPVLFEKLTSATLKSIARYKGIDAEIKKWQRSLTQIQDLLADASQKEITNQSVKRWLNDLQHLSYDIDDILDDLATEAMHREFTHQSEAIFTDKVRKLIPSCCTNFTRSTRMLDKLDNITFKLQELLKEKADLGLSVIEEPRPRNNNRMLQTSMLDASGIVGRQVEKEELVHKLLCDEPGDKNFSIVPIFGMGGVGKTTLARILYNEQEVKDHFELKAWVCVSDEFDSFGISKVIFQSVTELNKEFADLNLLQVALREQLKEKRFLLVLDDVWSESCDDWETLVGPFHACAPGSKIIMTTRKDKLLKSLGYRNLNQLGSLSHDFSLSLLALHALGVNNFDSHLSLKQYGEGIVKKCDGLPLALKALGRLLCARGDEEEYWKNVFESEAWRLPVEGEIVPALILSYNDLSARLKQLFAYCSLFPKDYLFNKEELVQLWMAEGFLHKLTPSDTLEECLGHEYFNELLSRSFFQCAPNNESLFVMHDMMNDLATFVASEFFLRLEMDTRMEVLEKFRHVSFIREKYGAYKKFEAFKSAKSLRTFLAMTVGDEEYREQRFHLSNKILVDLLPKLSLLRVIKLSNFEVTEVPETIGNLKHLRYLNLSRTKIKHLPENICNLYNLQTLILVSCNCLERLPYSFLKLKSLRHFDIRDTRLLKNMPFGIGELKSLQTLSKFIIGVEDGSKINTLKDLNNLSGKISIIGLEKVQNAMHAREANISQKRLSKLVFEWSNVSDGSRNEVLEKEVLNELKPSNECLAQLEIVSYGGLEFPNWVGDSSYLQLKNVSLRDCTRCTILPPLGQLPSLNELFISNLGGVEVVGVELFGSGRAFSSLEILCFERMHGWKKWLTNGDVFPCLKQLVIKDCPKLVEVTLETLPSLTVLTISSCPNLVEVLIKSLPSLNYLTIDKCDGGLLQRLVEVASMVNKMDISFISGLNDVVWRGVIEYLREIEELYIYKCNELRYLWESEAIASKVLVKLRKLEVSNCNNLLSLGEKEDEDGTRSNLITSVRMLVLYDCPNMKRCRCPDSTETLEVRYCRSMKTISLPNGGHKLKSFVIKGCLELLEKEWGGQTMLEYVYIARCRFPKSITELNCLVHLTELKLISCEGLESLPDNEFPSLTSLKRLLILYCPRIDAGFPRGFWPPNMQSLEIGKLKKPISEWGSQNFPSSLVELTLYGGKEDGVSSCSQFSNLLPSSLTSLRLHEFEKLESVSMGLHHLTSLQRLNFDSCSNLKEFSHLQHLTSLQNLYFRSCTNLKELSHLQHLTSLQHLSFIYCTNLKELSHFQHLPSLQNLYFSNCTNLKNLSNLQHLTSLQHLTFYNCPNMIDIPQVMLPSLLSFGFSNCPNLEERYSEGGLDHSLISHIPCITQT